jgi:site-specific DNA-adenine methylase
LEFIPRHVRKWINDRDWRVVRFLEWMRDDEKCIDQIMRLKAWTEQATADELAERFESAKPEFLDGNPLSLLLISRYALRQQYSARRSNIATFDYSLIGNPGGSGFATISRPKLERFRAALQGTRITCLDYSELLATPGDDCFIYLDPPWATCPSTYDFNFGLTDHLWLRARLRACPHSWLMSLGAELASLYPPDEFRVHRRIYRCRHPWGRPARANTELVIRPLRKEDCSCIVA